MLVFFERFHPIHLLSVSTPSSSSTGLPSLVSDRYRFFSFLGHPPGHACGLRPLKALNEHPPGHLFPFEEDETARPPTWPHLAPRS